MSEELRETIKNLQNNPLVKCGSYEFIVDSNITYAEIYILLEFIRSQEQENKKYKEAIDKLSKLIYKIDDLRKHTGGYSTHYMDDLVDILKEAEHGKKNIDSIISIISFNRM